MIGLKNPSTTVWKFLRSELSHLDALEAEAIHIFREGVAGSERPVLMYSVGKDSSVLLHVARKAFHPSSLPMPLLHVDTRWKFREMYRSRDQMVSELGLELIVHQNPECVERGINPIDHGSELHTDLWKTEGLKQAIEAYRFDLGFGGARRDEEKSRAKERVFTSVAPTLLDHFHGLTSGRPAHHRK